MKALVLCGGMPQLYLLKELRRRGITSVLADMNEKAPAVPFADKFYPISTLDIGGIRKLAEDEKVDFVISVCADQMLLVAAQVCEELGLPCYIDYETAKNVSNKEFMKKIFVENDVPTTKYFVGEGLDEEKLADMVFPLVVKPVDAYSSRGVKKVQNKEELVKAFEDAAHISRNNKAVVEEFFGGDEYSVDLYIEDGIAKVLCVRLLDKIPGNQGFVICRGRYPAPLSEKVYEDIRLTGQKIADAFQLKNTPMLIQMKVEEERLDVIEFCARTGGGIKYRLMPYVSGFDVVKAVLDLTLGQKPHYDGYHLNKYIVDEFIYCRPGVFDHLENFEELLQKKIIAHYDQFKAKGTVIKEASSSGDRVAYFSVEADTMEELREKYDFINQKIQAVNDQGEDMIRHEIMQFADY